MAIRISTSMIYSTGMSNMSQLQSQLFNTQQHITANTKLLTPADDPVGAARVLDLKQGQSMNTQFASNRSNATDLLTFTEGTLSSVTQRIQDMQTEAVAAGNGAYADEQRGYIAENLRSLLAELTSLANSKDGYGDYIFGGFQTSNPPFVSGANGIQFVGDTGQRQVQIDTARKVNVSDSGLFVFGKIGAQKATATITTTPPALPALPSTLHANPVVFDTSKVNNHAYAVVFTTPSTYQVFDTTLDPTMAGTPLQTGAYDSKTPAPIEVNGIRINLQGVPVAGDKVDVTTQAQDIFAVVQDLINIVEAPVVGEAGQADLKYGLEQANFNLASGLDNVLKVRASVGSRMQEVESLNLAGLDRGLQLTESIGNLTDLDYYQAISDLSQQKLTLEAAQKAFVQTSGLSLFSLM